MERESMEFDVVIVGAGPSGLGAAIRLKTLAAAAGTEVSVCILEKGSEVGAHILSGAVIDPVALDELIPDWRDAGAPLKTPVVANKHWVLTARGAIAMPHILLPPLMSNKGAYIISLGNLCRWLAARAEALGVEIYPGFAAAEVLYDEAGAVRGVATGDMGVGRDGERKPAYEPGIELHAKYTFFGEGCRGSLAAEVMERFGLRDGAEPQTYGLGVKELWEVKPEQHQPGLVIHTQGWPLDGKTAGGGFIYHLEDRQVAVGFVTALDYENPYLSPFGEMQRFKTHPRVRAMLEGGRRIAYGARAINEGGLQSVPKLAFPGGALVGCSAGFVNVPRIKGIHNAMKTGMLAADAAFAALADGAAASTRTLEGYDKAYRASWVWKDLHRVRNARPALKWGIFLGSLYSGVDMWLNNLGLGFLVPWTLGHHNDHDSLKPAADCQPIDYPKPDGKLIFDRLSSVYLTGTNHEEDQPVHLRLRDAAVPVALNLARYGAPEELYCPAGVYEILRDGDGANPRLQINAANCIHCKTCDIKDPSQNIHWVVPEGGGGPNYGNM